MVHHLADNGTMAIVLPHGALFRGGAEGHIRQYLIADRNYLDAVIGLPANMFYGTSIPTCILVFKVCRENPKDILFIDASREYEKQGTQNYLTDALIEKIVTTYRQRSAIEKYSYAAPLAEVTENDYNLNIPRYVDTFEAEEQIDIAAIAAELQGLEADMQATNSTIAAFCKELNIATPF
jgi:type I restriction enzyme M protein